MDWSLFTLVSLKVFVELLRSPSEKSLLSSSSGLSTPALVPLGLFSSWSSGIESMAIGAFRFAFIGVGDWRKAGGGDFWINYIFLFSFGEKAFNFPGFWIYFCYNFLYLRVVILACLQILKLTAGESAAWPTISCGERATRGILPPNALTETN